MILDKKIRIKGNSSNIKHFKKLGYDIKMNEVVEVDVNDLLKKSHVKINVKCDICKKIKKISYHSYYRNLLNGGFYTCEKCSQIKLKKTSMEKYGVEYPIQSKETKLKRKKNNIDKYGVDEPSKLESVYSKAYNTKKIKYGDGNYVNVEKGKETRKLKYGNENYNNREKCIKTCLKRYGVENVSKDFVISDKKKTTFLEHYGVPNYSLSEEFKNNQKDKIFNILKEKNLDVVGVEDQIATLKCDCGENHFYDIDMYILRNRLKYKTVLCTICNPVNSYTSSGKEVQIQNFIKNNYDKEIILNNRKIINGELDIFLPDLNLAFEFNGLYWHSELNKDNNYHLNKTELAENKGIKLIQIYEDDWTFKQDIVKSRILNLLNKSPNKIYARKCSVIEITDNKLVRDFLKTNHIQGFVGARIKIGLFYQDKLVSLMSFGDKRKAMGQKADEGSYEMLRFCNKLNTIVVGGASRLFRYFVQKYKPKEIISYADRSWSQGELYEKLGFQFVRKTDPNYYYIIDGVRKHRFNFRKDKLIKEGAEPSKTEHEIMLEKKIYRIYDSGNIKFFINNFIF